VCCGTCVCCLYVSHVAVGCPDFKIPPHAEVRRDNDHATITCSADLSRSWDRTCVGTKWFGEIPKKACPPPASSQTWTGSMRCAPVTDRRNTSIKLANKSIKLNKKYHKYFKYNNNKIQLIVMSIVQQFSSQSFSPCN